MNTFLAQLGAIDLRDRLPHRNWSIGTRSATTSLTLHYNGPPVAPTRQSGAGLITQLIADSDWQMRPGWGGTVNGAPHLMYHLVVASDGQIYQTADLSEILWHCAHADGNSHGLALHFPIGGGQQPSAAQMLSGYRAIEALRGQYQIPRNRVLGHQEWKHATECPGPYLMQRIVAYRLGMTGVVIPTPTPGLRRFQITVALANVRQGPATTFPVAGTLKRGALVYSDVQADGWLHLARVPNEQADLGFVAESLGVWQS